MAAKKKVIEDDDIDYDFDDDFDLPSFEDEEPDRFSKKRIKKTQAKKGPRKPEPWDDDWIDPEDIL